MRGAPFRRDKRQARPPDPGANASTEGETMRMIALLAALALAVPAAALATKPPTPGHSTGNNGKAAPKVTYILRGTLSLYTAATETSTGTVTLDVKHANHHGHTLVGKTLQFTLTTATKVVAAGGT